MSIVNDNDREPSIVLDETTNPNAGVFAFDQSHPSLRDVETARENHTMAVFVGTICGFIPQKNDSSRRETALVFFTSSKPQVLTTNRMA